MPWKTKEQHSTYNAQYRQIHREELNAKARAKRAENLEMALLAEKIKRERHREKRRAYQKQYRIRCRESILLKQAAYRNKDRVAYNAMIRASQKRHPERMQATDARRRARLHAAPINDLTAAQWQEIKAAYGYRCIYCGRKMQRLTQDHITPLARGGSHTASNIVPACATCNKKKQAGPVPCAIQPMLLTLAPSKKTEGIIDYHVPMVLRRRAGIPIA